MFSVKNSFPLRDRSLALTSPAESLQGFSPGGAVGKRVQTAPADSQGGGRCPGYARRWWLFGLGRRARRFTMQSGGGHRSCSGSGPCPALGSCWGPCSQPVGQAHGPMASPSSCLPLVTSSHQNKCQLSGPKTVMSSFSRRFHAPPRIFGAAIGIAEMGSERALCRSPGLGSLGILTKQPR